MTKPILAKDLEELCERHNISSAILVIPQEDNNFVMLTRAISPPLLRSIGRMLVKAIPRNVSRTLN